MSTSDSGSSLKFLWKIENFSSLGNTAQYSQAFYGWGVHWQLVAIRNYITQLVIGLSTLDMTPSYVKYSLAILNQKCEDQTRKYDMEREIRTEDFKLCKAMFLTEQLDPEKGFIVNDICYIKVEIFSALTIIESIKVKTVIEPQQEPEPAWGNWGNFFQTLIGTVVPSGGEVTENEGTTDSREKKYDPVSVEATTQAAGDSNSLPDEDSGENHITETKDEERSLLLPGWFQERKENIGKYFNDDSGYQRIQ